MSIEKFFVNMWHQPKRRLALLLWPVAMVYLLCATIRRYCLTTFIQIPPPVPIIVVGNITLGGVGKTPLVIAIAQHFLQQGLRVGIVSRGYRAKCRHFPHEVKGDDLAIEVGDEPLLLAQKLNIPVVIAPKRTAAVSYLLARHAVDLIISDDGLQHYALGRTIEIAVIDGTRGLGNRLIFPAGPLREPEGRLQQVDLRVINAGEADGAYPMHFAATGLKCIITGEVVAIDMLSPEHVSAVAGIGSPQRFFAMLTQLGIQFTPHVFPDHHAFEAQDFKDFNGIVVMTEKDAVKCHSFAKQNWYSLCIEAKLEPVFWQDLNRVCPPYIV